MSRISTTTIGSCAAAVWLTLAPASVADAAPVPPQAHPTPHAAPATPKQTPPATSKAHAPTPPTVAAHISANPELVTRLQPLLPSGMTLEQAAQGFRNQGQFIAALHVAHNLNIPFAQLKAEMTGPDHQSLGQAIHTLMPSANAKTEAKRAQDEVNQDLKTSRKPGDDNDRR